MESRDNGQNAQEARVGDRAETVSCEKIGREQDELRKRDDNEQHQMCLSSSECIEKSRRRDSKDQEIRVVEGLDIVSKYKKAQPDIIDEPEIIASTASHGLLRIERPFEAHRLFDRRVDERRIAQIGGKLGAQGREGFGVAGQTAIGEYRFDRYGQRVAVAAVVHLADGRTDAKKDATPISIADGVAKAPVDTDAKCRYKRQANDRCCQPT